MFKLQTQAYNLWRDRESISENVKSPLFDAEPLREKTPYLDTFHAVNLYRFFVKNYRWSFRGSYDITVVCPLVRQVDIFLGAVHWFFLAFYMNLDLSKLILNICFMRKNNFRKYLGTRAPK